ncbi:uncharacterized protein LOC110030878 [Phalaenopsis equestris]|uniref:uncharacterized protein LOC110030878 n=1 Tax=Phalaenopsis equestris TaxID=78828 RepID=UPI0009E51E79|nr:uncharacterized protein LOC110030878 [Phalaenopsis equestris]XP_020589496.1 uncharacterized protein LOC110030878 [Phalaenopsis equestris]
MESIRDEALRIKELAEKKFIEKDYVGAKNFVLTAQNLFPSLDGISQMITILDIYLASEAKLNGEKDWYGILRVNASADEETVKNHYRKLALMLHPDKNKSAGAEGAFQLVSEAWSVLSNKNQKMAYDLKIYGKSSHQRSLQDNKDSSAPGFDCNGFYQFSNNVTNKKRTKQSSSTKPPLCPPLQTFWTSCAACCMQYEYHRMYLNKSLLCPKCKQPFLATELPAPPSGLGNPLWSVKQQNQKAKHRSSYKNASSHSGMGASGFQHGSSNELFANQNIQWAPFSGAGTNGLSSGTNVVHQEYKVKRQREEAHTTVKWEESQSMHKKLSRRAEIGSGSVNTVIVSDNHATKRTGTGDDLGNNNFVDKVASDMGCSRNTVSETEKGSWFYSNSLKSRLNSRSANFNRAYTHVDVRAILIEKAKDAILKKLRELDLADAAKAKDNDRMRKKTKLKDVKLTKLADRKNAKYKVQRDSANFQIIGSSRGSKFGPVKELSQKNFSDDPRKQVNHHLTIDVPDPDFHDFDSDRTENAFEADQVWATYDDDDGMPRYYAFIQKVLSAKPFKVRMSFLTSKSNVEFGALDWVSRGFPKTCGDFRVGRYVVANRINIFSHRVKWEKGFRGVIKVLPRKGDIWALYRNWSPHWNELTPDTVIHKYEMVEILEDYDEDEGISVVPLVKVAGFKTVFLRHMDPKENKKLRKEEMFRFSHQVPSYLLTGEEAHNAPRDCLELDPAATSLELLQVLTETKDEDAVNDDERKLADNGVSWSDFCSNVCD